MKILFAYNIVPNDNEYVERLVSLTSKISNSEITCSLDEFWNPTIHYDYVVINWPEYLFGWRFEITNDDYERLVQAIGLFKSRNTKIISVLHDEYSHRFKKVNFNKIFDACYSEADSLIHLGNYSLNKYLDIYPHVKHYLVFHPHYKCFDLFGDNEKIRKKLGFKKEDFIVIVPGKIRKQHELEYASEIFKNLAVKRKKMIFLRLAILPKPQSVNEWYKIKYFIYFYFKKWYWRFFKQITFLDSYQTPDIVAGYFSAGNLVVIPRYDILNSGNITLGAQFGKKIIGTDIGNMSELLDQISAVKILNPADIKNSTILNELTRFNADEIKNSINMYSNDEIIVKQLEKVFA